ncbi:MAG: 2-dehydropantoate 2-reductase, partial [Tannerellaceae bacterium]
MRKTRIVISGLGAVGGYYGGLLAKHYNQSDSVEIIFIARGENLQIIQAKGLTIKTSKGNIKAQPTLVTDNPAEVGVADYLFCCTKSYDLEANMAQLAPLIGEDTTIIPLLNGADITERIQQILPQHEVWKGCVYICSRLVKPGVVNKFSEKERLFFGSEKGSKARQQELLSLLTNAGINAFNPENIAERIWKKFFMISTAATITAYFNQPIDKVIDQHYDMFVSLGLELRDVAAAKSIVLPDEIVFTSIESQKMMPNGATTSMHTDFKKGKNTELESLTGYVIRAGEEL